MESGAKRNTALGAIAVVSTLQRDGHRLLCMQPAFQAILPKSYVMPDFLTFASTKSSYTLSVEEIRRWAGTIDNWDFYNTVALDIARGYYLGELSYTFCDSVVNDLWVAVIEGLKDGEMVPYPFYDVYEAFDAGEFHHTADKSDDPKAEFTDPAIAEVIRLHGL